MAIPESCLINYLCYTTWCVNLCCAMPRNTAKTRIYRQSSLRNFSQEGLHISKLENEIRAREMLLIILLIDLCFYFILKVNKKIIYENYEIQ